MNNNFLIKQSNAGNAANWLWRLGRYIFKPSERVIADVFTKGQRATQLGVGTAAAGVPVGAYYLGKYMGRESTPTETEPATPVVGDKKETPTTGANEQQGEKTKGTPAKPGIYDDATKWISENPWTTALLGGAGVAGLGYLLMDDEDEDEDEE